ncbi:MAG: response regulator transcription factor [Sterolibacterium sp.]|jgi:DNA-binding response OmpR family regulator|nr:response regulator transcription factor [Sterolibacterium sp.]
MNIVVVEDEEALREEVVFYLQRAGHTVIGVGSAAELYRHLSLASVELIVLDLGLPDEDGLSIAAHLASQSYGLVMLTARSSIDDRILGLREGADAYLTKPIDFGLLNATLESVHRRLTHATTSAARPTGGGTWQLDSSQWTLSTPDGKVITLTANENQLLKMLFSKPGETVDRRLLMRSTQAGSNSLDPRRLEALISRLRQKILQITPTPLPLRTVHGSGYAIVPGD